MNVSISDDGMLVYSSGTTSGTEMLTWYDRSGKKMGTVGEQGEFYDLDLSPDGKKIATTETEHGRRHHLGARPGNEFEDEAHIQWRSAPDSDLVSRWKTGRLHFQPAGRHRG